MYTPQHAVRKATAALDIPCDVVALLEHGPNLRSSRRSPRVAAYDYFIGGSEHDPWQPNGAQMADNIAKVGIKLCILWDDILINFQP